MIVAFLQNAWSPVYAGGTWPRRSWLRALHASRSGQRLAILTGAATGLEFWFDNTTPIVGAEPSSIVEPDAEHIAEVVRSQNPGQVIAMGKQAAAAVAPFVSVPMLIVPHPAYRCLTNALYERAGEMLVDGFSGIIELKQGRGVIQTVEHDVTELV